MAEEYPSTPPPSRPGPSEPWRKQHMVQRVPAHLDESSGSPPWLVVVGIVVAVVIVCALVFFLLGGTARLSAFGFGGTATPSRTRTPPSPPITIIPVIIPTGTPTAGPTAVMIKYRVRPGDTLSSLADRYRVSIKSIMQANGLKDETIRIGEDLLIPLPTPTPLPGSNPPVPPAGTPSPISFDSPPPSADTAATPGVIRHTVQRGDTLIGIAAQYGSTVNAIKIANQLDSDVLSIGQVLMVPVGSWTPTPTTVSDTLPTPTSQFAYPAPSLISPPDNFTFRGSKDVPVLQWLSPAILKPGEFYVVHLESGPITARKIYPSLTVRQGTSAKLDPTQHYAGANPNGTLYSWYVVILSGTVSPQGIPQGIAQSPLSTTRTFVWY